MNVLTKKLLTTDRRDAREILRGLLLASGSFVALVSLVSGVAIAIEMSSRSSLDAAAFIVGGVIGFFGWRKLVDSFCMNSL